MGKKLLKAFASGSILAAIAYLILGIILVLKPEISLITIVRIGGIAALLVGLFDIVFYLFKDISGGALNNLLTGGIILVVAGILVIIHPTTVASFIPITLGCAIILGGLIKLQRSIDLLRLRYEGWIFVLVLAVLDVVVGIVMVANPFKAATTLMLVTGIGLLLSGLTTLVTVIIVGRKVKKIQDALEKEAQKAEAIEGEAVPQPYGNSTASVPSVSNASPVPVQGNGETSSQPTAQNPAPKKSTWQEKIEQRKAAKEAQREKKRVDKEAEKLREKAEKDHNEAQRQQKEVDAIIESRLGSQNNNPQEAAQPSGGYVPTYRQNEAAQAAAWQSEAGQTAAWQSEAGQTAAGQGEAAQAVTQNEVYQPGIAQEGEAFAEAASMEGDYYPQEESVEDTTENPNEEA